MTIIIGVLTKPLESIIFQFFSRQNVAFLCIFKWRIRWRESPSITEFFFPFLHSLLPFAFFNFYWNWIISRKTPREKRKKMQCNLQENALRIINCKVELVWNARIVFFLFVLFKNRWLQIFGRCYLCFSTHFGIDSIFYCFLCEDFFGFFGIFLAGMRTLWWVLWGLFGKSKSFKKLFELP